MECREYDRGRDRDAAHRIWHEVGWVGREHDTVVEEALDGFFECGRALVAEVNGEAEALVLSAPGSVRYLAEDLPFACVTGVTVSRVARKLGLGRALTARLVAADAASGALVSGLGMFEQGFYDALGFGSGGYEHILDFDPAHLTVSAAARVPGRFGAEDWEVVHALRLDRRRGHGACNLDSPAITRGEMLFEGDGFGLGYRDGPDDTPSHLIWFHDAKGETGPYQVGWLSYRTREQFLELAALLRSLGDQVRLLHMREPPNIQMQDLLDRPFQRWAASERSRYESRLRAAAYWQMRINDLPGCLARTHLRGVDLRFNLELRDPITHHLPADSSWRGVGGGYVVHLGPQSGAERGRNGALPTLSATVNAFTRLWLGVRPATGLAVTDELSAPPDLLVELDRVLRLPDPKPDWDF